MLFFIDHHTYLMAYIIQTIETRDAAWFAVPPSQAKYLFPKPSSARLNKIRDVARCSNIVISRRSYR